MLARSIFEESYFPQECNQEQDHACVCLLEYCTYTPLGQPMERTTATGDKITYQYSFDRLTKINYPDSTDNVIYTYADSTVKNITQRCRLIRVDDASGAECYIYGDMGVITKTARTINIDTLRHLSHTYVYGAEYDSWGRVLPITPKLPVSRTLEYKGIVE